MEAEVVADDELVFDDALGATLARRECAPAGIVREGDLLAGKYRVERSPGRAGLSVIAQVRHLELGQEVTLKLLIPDACAYPEFVQRFIREARAAVRIGGEHVARVTDVGRLDSGAPYMVREYLRGPDLAEVLRVRGPLPISEAVDYIVQAAEGVAEGHALGVVHRNLRPTTLVVCRRSDGTPLVKVFDFAAAETLHIDPFTERAVALVGTSAIMASLPYMAPEQIRDPLDVDARADVYALGAILHELLTGVPVYRGDNAPSLLAAVAADAAPAVRSLRSEVPDELDQVVLRCMAKNRALRYSTIGDLVGALAPFASSEVQGALARVMRLERHSSAPHVSPRSQEDARKRSSEPPRTPEPPSLEGRRSLPPAMPVGPAESGAAARGNAADYAPPHRPYSSTNPRSTLVPPSRNSVPGGVSRSWVPGTENPAVSNGKSRRTLSMGLIAACGVLGLSLAIGVTSGSSRRAAAAKPAPAVAPRPAAPALSLAAREPAASPGPRPAVSGVPSAALSASPIPSASAQSAPATVRAQKLGSPPPAPVARSLTPRKPAQADTTRPPAAKVASASTPEQDLFSSPD